MVWVVLILLLIACACVPSHGATVDELHARLTKLQRTLDSLTRQAMLQQLFLEEKVRGDGDSGVDRIPIGNGGTRPYHVRSYLGPLYGNHNIPDAISTDGFNAVLNGVKFRKYAEGVWLKRPHRHSKNLGATENVGRVGIPPAVLQKKTVAEQVTEMAEWFRAFKESNYKVRDFRPYFRPLLCYLEGYWEQMRPAPGKYFDDSFNSLENDFRFEAGMGRMKHYWTFRGFNPSTVFDFVGTEPRFAKFKSRILCPPTRFYVTPDRLRAVDDLTSRVPSFRSYIDYSRADSSNRFSVNQVNSNKWTDRHYRDGLIDRLMAEIPGLDNYKGSLTDGAFELPALLYPRPTKTVNSGFYHRWYNIREKGAMGQQVRHRGYSDANIFMAQNSQASIPAMSVEDCRWINRKRVCKTYTQRWSYAIPLAIIYQTPIQHWNPYNIQEKRFGDFSYRANGRNGGFAANKAFNGTSPHGCVRLPPEFLNHGPIRGVLDRDGRVVQARTCGIRSIIKNIKGIGDVRQVFSIFPAHAEGRPEFKEMEALKDVVMETSKRLQILRN